MNREIRLTLQTNDKHLKITADINTDNKKFSRILEKFMNPVREFLNKEDNCTDRRYEITKTGYNTS